MHRHLATVLVLWSCITSAAQENDAKCDSTLNSYMVRVIVHDTVDLRQLADQGLSGFLDELPAVTPSKRGQLDRLIERFRSRRRHSLSLHPYKSGFLADFSIPQDVSDGPTINLYEGITTDYFPQVLAHELGHFKTWDDVRTRLIRKGIAPAQADTAIERYRSLSPAHLIRQIVFDETVAVKTEFAGLGPIPYEAKIYPLTEGIIHGLSATNSLTLPPRDTSEYSDFERTIDSTLRLISDIKLEARLDAAYLRAKVLAAISQVRQNVRQGQLDPSTLPSLKDFVLRHTRPLTQHIRPSLEDFSSLHLLERQERQASVDYLEKRFRALDPAILRHSEIKSRIEAHRLYQSLKLTVSESYWLEP